MASLPPNELVSLLVQHLAHGTLKGEDVLPLLQQLVGDSGQPPSATALLDAIGDDDRPAWKRLRDALRRKLLKDACALHDRRLGGQMPVAAAFPDLVGLPLNPPLGWRPDHPFVESAERLLDLTRARYFLAGRAGEMPVIRASVEKAFQEEWARFAAYPARWDYLKLDPATPSPEENFLAGVARRFSDAAGDRPKQQEALDEALVWPGDASAALIPKLCVEAWARERAALILMLRFGKTTHLEWRDWERWLGVCEDLHAQRRERMGQLVEHAREMVKLWWAFEYDAGAVAEAEVVALECAREVDAELFASHWRGSFGPHEINRLLGLREPPPLPSEREAGAEGVADSVASRVPGKVAPHAPPPLPPVVEEEPAIPEPPRPSVWHDQIQPFLAENRGMALGIMAGVVAVIIGASLFAYGLWDHAWYWKYLLLPPVLAGLTLLLSETGIRLARRFSDARGAALLLQLAAIGLLPVNFMTVALMSNDSDVQAKGLVVPLAAVVYMVVFGWGLWRGCGSVLPSLGWLQGGALLCLNALVALGPLARQFAGPDQGLGLVVGFYVGFVVLGLALIRFAWRVLTPEMAAEKLVPWFFGGTLALTYAQVFAWVHLTMEVHPLAEHYAVLAVLAGGLVLLMERRFIELQPGSSRRIGESFIGYALIFLGVLMGMGSPPLRIATLALAGGVWLRQAGRREGYLHYWIGLTLLMLAGASVSLLEGFPKNADFNGLPWLGLIMALVMSALRQGAKMWGNERLRHAANEFLAVVLMLTAVVSVLSQWQLHSAPRETAAALLVTAAYFAWRAHCVQRLGWAHTTMALLAVALPYLGCVDMVGGGEAGGGRTLYGNTMVFGLAVVASLWLGWIRVRPTPLLVQARSTVLWTYGALAVAAMLVRVALEQGTPGDQVGYRLVLDIAGPILMCVVLVATAYHSRSFVPSAMAAVIMAVLFPELKDRMREAFPAMHWGTGFGSSCSALGLLLAAFAVRRMPLLQNMGEGDLFLGRRPFPLRRFDASLFTIPILCTALFMMVRVDVWIVTRDYLGDGVAPRTACALLVTGFSWILLAIHGRESRVGARLALHASWIVFFLGFHFLNPELAGMMGVDPADQAPPVWTGALLQILYWIYLSQAGRFPWARELLADTTRMVLRRGSLVLGWLVAIILLGRTPWTDLNWLAAFLGLQLAWHGLSGGRRRHGAALFMLALVFLVSWSAEPEAVALLRRLSFGHTFTPLLCFVAAIELGHLMLEASPALYARVRPLQAPFQVGGAAVLVLASGGALVEMIGGQPIGLTTLQQTLLALALLAAARANRSGALLLILVSLGFVFLQTPELAFLRPELRVAHLVEPWQVATLAALLSALAFLGIRMNACCPRLTGGPYATWPDLFPSRFWLLAPSVVLAVQAFITQMAWGPWRDDPQQLWAPYLSAAALALTGFAAPHAMFFIMAAVSLTAANVHFINIHYGTSLEAIGVKDIHMVCVGFLFTLAQGTAARLLIRREAFTRAVNQWSLFLAGLVLVLLPLNYMVYPDLKEITAKRFALSAGLAFFTGLYYRWASRHPGPGEEKLRDWYEAMYHFGLAMTFLCGALSIPQLRDPNTVFLALAAPAIFFYLRTEIARGRESEGVSAAYLRSATVMGFLLLIFYASRTLFRMVLFPTSGGVDTDHYHMNAPLVVALSFMLFRLRGLGGSWWLAFYGGLALITGTFFTVTGYRELSPFERPIGAAWAAVGVAHLFILASRQRSPIRTMIQEIGAIDGEEWITLRAWWGRCLLVASQIVIALGLRPWKTGYDSYQVAPLIAGAASIWLHQAVVGRIAWYGGVSAALLVLALHVDFLGVASHLEKDQVIWVVLGIWLAAVVSRRLWCRWVAVERMSAAFVLIFALSAAHLLRHGPASNVGLCAAALITLLGMFTPRAAREAPTAAGRFFAWLPVFAAPWIVYFSQVRDGEMVVHPLAAWPVLSTTAVLLATGALARMHSKGMFPGVKEFLTAQPRVYHQTLALLGAHGRTLDLLFMGFTTAVISLMLVAHYQVAYAGREFVVGMAIWAGLAAAWFYDGRERASMFSQILAQFSVLGLFALVRQQLKLKTGHWLPEYDMWISLAVSACIAGAKQHLDRQSPQVRVPMMGTLFALPVVAMIWTQIHGFNSNITLVIVGLNSLIFAFLGRDDRESPYNMVAIVGFIAFVLVLFASKLHFEAWHAYIIPVGVGVLALLHVGGGHLDRETKSLIRWATLSAMIGSAGYYALIKDSSSLGFNATMLLLCLAAMGVGTFFCVRLYLFMGFGGVVVNLLSLLYKGLSRTMNHLTMVGLLLILVGAALVVGFVYAKAHQKEIEEWLAKWRAKFGTWE